jgi:hypothetical protein
VIDTPEKHHINEEPKPVPQQFPSKDEGDVGIAIHVKDNICIVHFGKELSWIGLEKPQLENFIGILQEKLQEME